MAIAVGRYIDLQRNIKGTDTSDAVEFTEPNYPVKTNDLPDDPRFSDLWGLNNTGQSTVQLRYQHPRSLGDIDWITNVIVAVIDTGVELLHEDLVDNMGKRDEIPNNGIDDDQNGYIDDVNGWDFCDDDDPLMVGTELMSRARLPPKPEMEGYCWSRSRSKDYGNTPIGCMGSYCSAYTPPRFSDMAITGRRRHHELRLCDRGLSTVMQAEMLIMVSIIGRAEMSCMFTPLATMG